MMKGSFFAAMDAETRKRFLDYGARKAYPKGKAIFEQGADGASMLVISTGRAEITRVGENGASVVLGQLGPGDVAGELALLDKAPRSASVTAATPITCVLLTFADVESFLLAHPRVMFGLLADLAGKLRAANALAENRALDSGAARLARCLLDLADRWGEEDAAGEIRITEAFSQGALGQMAHLSRENVNRLLRAWEKDGWIAKEGGRLRLVDDLELESIAAAEERGR